jgi:hypothetical protein
MIRTLTLWHLPGVYRGCTGHRAYHVWNPTIDVTKVQNLHCKICGVGVLSQNGLYMFETSVTIVEWP